jgi:hypothetical protein
MRNKKTMSTEKTTGTMVLNWQLRQLGINPPENTLTDPVLLTGLQIKDSFDKGYRLTIEDYVLLTDKITPEFNKQYNNFIEEPFSGLHRVQYETYLTYILDFYGKDGTYTDMLGSYGLRPMDNNIIERLFYYCSRYEAVRNGFIDDSIKVDFRDIEVHREEIKDLFFLLNGVYTPSGDMSLEAFNNGLYSKWSYIRMRYIVKDICENEPALIGSYNKQLVRENILLDILEDVLV